jgi:hypothetical protein
MLCSRNEAVFKSTGEREVKPLEQEVMAMLHTEKRFTDFGCRCQINYPNIALLVKNMPLDDRARYGRLKDTIPFILSAADAKVRLLETESVLQKQNKLIGKSVVELQLELTRVTNMLNENSTELGCVMLGLSTEVSRKMTSLGLDQDQEEYVLAKIEAASKKLFTGLDRSREVESFIKKIADVMQGIEQDQKMIINKTLAVEHASEMDSVANDVELF